ncbi:hypothetical protein EDC01DRAFT_137536 [Geopyxis carbonaria]|nr:hypothetical protein EDC01DRAFT_137536 [Geopyxis carbonaria]
MLDTADSVRSAYSTWCSSLSEAGACTQGRRVHSWHGRFIFAFIMYFYRPGGGGCMGGDYFCSAFTGLVVLVVVVAAGMQCTVMIMHGMACGRFRESGRVDLPYAASSMSGALGGNHPPTHSPWVQIYSISIAGIFSRRVNYCWGCNVL